MNKTAFLVTSFIITITLIANAHGRKDVEEFNNTVQSAPCNQSVIYQLFPTKNMWTFLKLNTKNGQIWQVQYDVEGDNRFETSLNMFSLVDDDKEINGRFTLYETQNSWTFILLDQIDGKMWQVQWSLDAETRGIIGIY